MKLAEILYPQAPTKAAEQLLEDLAESLDIPASRYEAAERSYKSVGQWLDRPESLFANVGTTIYPQGSFRLGTVIRPLNGDEDYDLDAVCELDFSKSDLTQAQLKERLGIEMKAYAKAHGMADPIEARRCWTLNYADGAQFHMDVLPALPDGARQRLLMEALGYANNWAEMAVAITDITHGRYRVRSEDWPASNPKGYSEWFRAKMQAVFDAKRQAIALKEARASVEEIPEYRVKTPLQSAIQILKRHRDIRFSDEPDTRPISIILTMLSAHAYNQETTISDALYGILMRMDRHIDDRDGAAWIANPTDPRENFADKWEANPERKEAFYEWLEMAREDFAVAARLSDVDQLVDALSPRMGRTLMEAAASKQRPRGGLLVAALSAPKRVMSNKLKRLLDAPHKKAVVWPELARGSVKLDRMTVEQRGYRPRTVQSDADPIPKHCNLTFEATANVPEPYKVFWQVVNAGDEARQAKGLRGGFDEGFVQAGRLTRRESTLYSGSHSIECLIVKDGYCVARSGPFVVNIA